MVVGVVEAAIGGLGGVGVGDAAAFIEQQLVRPGAAFFGGQPRSVSGLIFEGEAEAKDAATAFF